jgi:hypothetical protein
MAALPEAADFAVDRQRILRAVADLSGLAQARGHLRSGFADDLVLMLMAHRGVQDIPHEAGLQASRRLCDRGLRRLYGVSLAAM